MMMADQGGNPHDMVHVGMSDEYCINRLDNPFGKMDDLAAIEEQRSLEGADPQEEKWIIQQPSEKCRFNVAEWKAASHRFSPSEFHPEPDWWSASSC